MTGPIVLATRNSGKLRELRPLFAAAGLDVVDLTAVGLAAELPEEVEVERFATFAENARAKARYFFARAGGLPCVADDSGLEVLALGGRPGVRSRRWAADGGRAIAAAAGAAADAAPDAANNARLIREMAGSRERGARFVCAAAFCDGAREIVCTGTVEGAITEEPRGAGGFGYDPYFFASELGKTLAEASIEEKATVSHRARAFRALIAQISSPG